MANTPKVRLPKPAIVICGLAGSGKSTAAKLLAKRFRIPHVSAGDLFRAIAKERKMSLIELGRYAEKHPEFDKDLDALMMRRLAKGRVVVDGRAAAYLARKRRIPALKIFLTVDPKVSAERVAKRDGISARQALAASRLREKEVQRRLKRLYGLDTRSTAYYDAVVQTDLYSPEQTVDIISRLVR